MFTGLGARTPALISRLAFANAAVKTEGRMVTKHKPNKDDFKKSVHVEVKPLVGQSVL